MVARDSRKTWLEDFDYFKAQLKQGRRFQRIIERKLKKAGVRHIEVPENGFEGIRDRDDLKAIDGFTKFNNDIRIGGRLFELKSRKVDFTCPADFPYDTVIVDTTSASRKVEKPVGYIFISTVTHRLIALSRRETRKAWTKDYLFDHERQIRDWFYLCPKELLHDEETLVDTLRTLKPMRVAR